MTRAATASASLVGRVAGLVMIACLQGYWFLQPGSVTLKALAALLVAVSVASPALGLMAFAGVAPVSTFIASLSGGGAGIGAQLLEQTALGIGAGVLARGGGPADGRTRIGGPALLVSVVAVASAAVMMPAAATPVTPGLTRAGILLQQLLDRQAAPSSPMWAPVFAAVTIMACGLLGWSAERVVRRSPQLAIRLVAIGLIGHAGAALLNLNAVVVAAARSGDFFEALPGLFLSLRVSMQTDVHAAASALLLAGVAGFGLMTGSLARRTGIGLLLVIVGAGLWITGSRVAIALGIVAAVGAIGWSAGRGSRWRFLTAGIVVIVIGAGVWLSTVYPSWRYTSTTRSASSRLVLMKAGIQMFEGAPLFGIGITRFYATSAEVVGPGLLEAVGYSRENAHNNFIQVLAEQGLVGLGAMLWWLAVILLSAGLAQFSRPDARRAALFVAIVACLGTWLTGHPLLVPEFALVFWLYCGVLTAMTPPPAATSRRWLLWLVVAGVLVSVPSRANVLLNALDLEHRGVGLSALWQHDDEQRYREAGASFAIYLPATGRPVEVPMRRAPGAPGPLLVDVRIAGRLIDTIPVGGDGWQTAWIQIPKGPSRFVLVDFAVRLPASTPVAPPVLLRVGRDAAR